MTPLVSVVIPCRNQAIFLQDAIESAQLQDYPALEVVVVDDGSDDATLSIARSNAQVHIVAQGKLGRSAARNAGVAASQGDFLVFLDADDRLLPGALSAGSRMLDARPDLVMTHGHFRFIDALGRRVSRTHPPCATSNHYLALLRLNYIAMLGAVMIRRDAFYGVAGFDTSLDTYEDHDLFLRLARAGSIACHHQLVAEYRRHSANTSDQALWMLDGAFVVMKRELARVPWTSDFHRAFSEGMQRYRRHYRSASAHAMLSDLKSGAISRRTLLHAIGVMCGAPSNRYAPSQHVRKP